MRRVLQTFFPRAASATKPAGRTRYGRLAAALAVAASLSSSPLLALDPGKLITQYVHDVWDVADGLPQSSAVSVTRTTDGYLWFGTESGLVRFDGVRFTVFDRRNTPLLADDAIYRLLADRRGGLWICSGGLSVRLKDGAFTQPTKAAVSPFERACPFFEDSRGGLWARSPVGVVRFEDGKPKRPPALEALKKCCNTVFEDREGTIWLGTAGEGLGRLRGDELTVLTTKDGLPSDRVRAILQDREGSLWIGTRGGVSRYRDGTFRTWTKKDGLADDTINALLEDRDGNVWVAAGAGLSRLREGQLTTLGIGEASIHQITSLVEDPEGSLWIGTIGSGLHRLRDAKFTAWTAKEGLGAPGFVASLAEDRDGAVWMGTLNGLYRLKDGAFTSLTTKDGLSHDAVYALLAAQDGSLWIGTGGGGLNRLADGKLTRPGKDAGLATAFVNSLLEDREGNIWIGTNLGLYRLVGGRFTRFTKKDGLLNEGVSSLLEDRAGALWIGTFGEGLNRLEGGRFTAFTTKEGLSHDLICSSALVEGKDGAVWVATWRGLSRVRDGKVTSLLAGEGPFDDGLFRLVADERGSFWTASNKGVFRVDARALEERAEGRRTDVPWTLYDKDDGLPIAEGSCCGRLRTRDGRLWFPTMKGVAVVDPARIPTNKVPPPVVIEEVHVDGRPSVLPRSGGPLIVSAGTAKLEVRYTALSFVVPKRVKFRYRLEGYDRDWVDAGTERVAHYTNLPPRAYTFRVIACNDDGLWNEKGASLSIRLLPFFWQTGWFSGLEVLAALGALAGALLLQRRRLDRRKARELAEELRTADLARKTEELEQARRVQLALLPKEPLTVGPFTVAGGMQTATEVGGDYYGYLEAGGRLCVVIGDATGHGMSSGLVAGMLKAALATLSRTEVSGLAPSRWLSDLNEALRTSISRRGLGVCAGIALVDVESGTVELGMAGIPNPFLVSATGAVERLVLSGTPLGYLKRLLPASTTRRLAPGDRLVLLTDGLIEQTSASGEEWGYAGVEATLAVLASPGAPVIAPEGIAEALLAACERYGAGQRRTDDRTVVVMVRGSGHERDGR